MHRSLAPAVLACLLMALAGCGGDDVVVGQVGNLLDSDAQSSLPGAPDAGLQGDRRLLIVPLHDAADPLSLVVGEEIHVFARVIDLATGGPADGATLSAELVPIQPAHALDADGLASLSAASTVTDVEGMATVIVRGGTLLNTLYELTFSAAGALPATVEVQVTDIPRGDLRVVLDYDGPIPLQTIRVGLRKGTLNCSQYHADVPPDATHGSKTVVGVGSRADFTALEAGEQYVVFATATTVIEGEGEHLAAGGCLDSVYVVPHTGALVTLTLDLEALRLTGAYRVSGLFDFTQVAEDFLDSQGLAGEIVADVIRFFREPGTIVLKYVLEAAKQFLPPALVDLAWDVIGAPIEDAVNGWLLGIDALSDFWTIGQDLTQVVSDLELISLMRFSKVYSDFSLTGKEEFIGLALRWRYGCPQNDPACGRYEYTVEQFNQPEFPLDLASSTFNASIVNWNVLTIDPHVIQLNYGKLILFGLNHIILPVIANGETNLGAAMKQLIDCKSVGSIAGALDAQVEAACNSALGLIGGFIETLLAGLRWDSNLSLHGSTTLIDDDDTLVVDRMYGGQYFGTVVISGSRSSPFTATFSGARVVE